MLREKQQVCFHAILYARTLDHPGQFSGIYSIRVGVEEELRQLRKVRRLRNSREDFSPRASCKVEYVPRTRAKACARRSLGKGEADVGRIVETFHSNPVGD